MTTKQRRQWKAPQISKMSGWWKKSYSSRYEFIYNECSYMTKFGLEPGDVTVEAKQRLDASSIKEGDFLRVNHCRFQCAILVFSTMDCRESMPVFRGMTDKGDIMFSANEIRLCSFWRVFGVIKLGHNRRSPFKFNRHAWMKRWGTSSSSDQVREQVETLLDDKKREVFLNPPPTASQRPEHPMCVPVVEWSGRIVQWPSFRALSAE